MAKLVIADAELHQWFDDAPPPSRDGKLSVDENDISAMRRARIQVGSDLDYLPCSLPSPDDFPTWLDLVGLHRDLAKARTIEGHVSTGTVLALADSKVETFRNAQELLHLVTERQALRAKLRSTGEAWKEPLGTRLSEVAADDAVTGTLRQICVDVLALESARRALLPRAIELPEGAERDTDFLEALDRVIAGQRAFALPFGKGVARKLVGTVTVLGAAPSSADDWSAVKELVEWRHEVRKALARWSAIATEFGLRARCFQTCTRA